jgi:hypothetical protein
MDGTPLALAFITPLFFWAGLGLVALPILIHILNRRRFKVVNWAAMEFLLRAMRKNRRRLRFEQMLLLATRCLVLLLLGLALSRPLGCQNNSLAALAGQRSGLHVLVIDNSYPMSYQADRADAVTQLDQAKIIAKALIRRLSSGGESVAVVTASRPARAVIATPAYDLKAAEAAVDRIEQSWAGTDEAGALILARDIGRADASQLNKTLYLIDDSRRVAWQSDPDAIRQAGKDLADVFKTGIFHFNLGKSGEWNQAVVSLHPAQSLVTTRFPADFVADVRGFGVCPTDPRLRWKVDDDVVGPAGVTVKANDSATNLTMTATGLSGGIHVISALLAGDDRLPVDNARYAVVEAVTQLKVLIVEGERGIGGLGSSGAFLDTALNPAVGAAAAHMPPSYVATERISDLELGNKILSDYRCICLCGVGQIQEAEAAQLEKFVRQGGTLMVFMGDPVTAENYNVTLYKHHLLPGPLTRRVTVAADQPARRFDFNPHRPLNRVLADFQNQENTGMEAAEIYSYWQVALPANSPAQRVLDFLPPDDAKAQPRDPAITVQSLGHGQVVFYATSADPNSEWTTFMAHQAYPALMHMLLLGTVSNGDDWMNITVEQRLTIPPWIQLTAEPVLRDSAQVEYPLQQETEDDGQAVYRSKPPGQVGALSKPGIFTLSTGTGNFKVAVNVPSDQADIRTIDDAAVKRALGDIDLHLEGDSVPVDIARPDQGKEMGWAIMVGVLALLALECVLAMRFGHQRRKPV